MMVLPVRRAAIHWTIGAPLLVDVLPEPDGVGIRARAVMSATRSRNAIHFHSLTSAGSGSIAPSCRPPNTCTSSFSIKPPDTGASYWKTNSGSIGQVKPISCARRRRAASAALSPGSGWLQQALVHNPPE